MPLEIKAINQWSLAARFGVCSSLGSLRKPAAEAGVGSKSSLRLNRLFFFSPYS